MISYPYIIIDDNQESLLKTRAMASGFHKLSYAGSASNYADGLNLILEKQPKLVFLEISPEDPESNLSLHLINELYRYLKIIPKIIITTGNKELAFEAIRYEVSDYLLKPLHIADLRKAILKIEKSEGEPPPHIAMPIVMSSPESVFVAEPYLAEEEDILAKTDASTSTPQLEDKPSADNPSKGEKPLIICVKSYGDYRFINADDICYLQADNNSTDIHLNNGEMITAFKTLKHFENILMSPFVRIHNSYIVNIDYVSRIHTGNAVCYIKNTTTKLPFSKSYKENIDAVLNSITKGNYLEI